MQRVGSAGRARTASAARTFGLVSACLVMLLVLAGVTTAVAQPAPGDTLEWLDDYQEALARARAEGLPLLVEFRCAP